MAAGINEIWIKARQKLPNPFDRKKSVIQIAPTIGILNIASLDFYFCFTLNLNSPFKPEIAGKNAYYGWQ